MSLTCTYVRERGSVNDRYPYETLLHILQVHFYLYTRSNPDHEEELPFDYESISWSHYDGSKKTFVVIHGWTSDLSFTDRFNNGGRKTLFSF